MKADHYYGDIATGYESKRNKSKQWKIEQQAITDWVVQGPVLDCPVGTGRYFDIYKNKLLDVVGLDISDDMLEQARIKYPWANLVKGSVFNLPWEDRYFSTVVCTRLMNWLYPDDMQRAIKELKRVTNTLIIDIRLGREGHHKETYTHNPETFKSAIKGMKVHESRCITGGRHIYLLSHNGQ